MNLLLIDPEGVRANEARLHGRQVEHCARVLRTRQGDKLRVGITNHGTCDAQVISISEEELHLRLGPLTPTPRPSTTVILSVPRPKVLGRCISAIASFGAERIFLINAWKVEKSYFSSPRLKPDRLSFDAQLGCEQGAQVWLPDIEVVTSFRRFLEDLDPELSGSRTAARLLLHPGGNKSLAQGLDAFPRHAGRRTLLALGPEGGFIEQELESFTKAGYEQVSLMTGALKTEVAVAAALGQLSLVEHTRKNRL